MFRSVLVSSPGKVILHGEHAVVYGKPAIAASADLRCFLLIQTTNTHSVVLNLPDMQLRRSWDIPQLCDLLGLTEDERLDVLRHCSGVDQNSSMQNLACLVLLYLLIHIWGDRVSTSSGAEVTISSQLPFGAGLGSSAAYSVCIAASLLVTSGQIRGSLPRRSGPTPHESSHSSTEHSHIPVLLRQKLGEDQSVLFRCSAESSWSTEELELINKWGFEAEKMIHGTPSGIDNCISVHGGAITFQNGNFSSLEHMPSLAALLVYTKVPRSTKKMVAEVRQRYDKHPTIVGPLLSSMEAITEKAKATLQQFSAATTDTKLKQLHSTLKDLFCFNHHLLNTIGVGHPALDKVCRLAAEAGLAAKLTGAGGGGCAVVLLPPEQSREELEKLMSQIEESGFECWVTRLGSSGVALHTDCSQLTT